MRSPSLSGSELSGISSSPDASAGTSALWRTDLSAVGTGRIDSLDLSAPSGVWNLYPLGDRLIAFGGSPSGSALWVSDGTVLGTRIVRFQDTNLSVPPVAFAGRIWFLDHSSPRRLWSTDGTAGDVGPDAPAPRERALQQMLLSGGCAPKSILGAACRSAGARHPQNLLAGLQICRLDFKSSGSAPNLLARVQNLLAEPEIYWRPAESAGGASKSPGST